MKKYLSLMLAGTLVLPPLLLTACGTRGARSSYTIRAEYLPEEGKLVAEMQANIVNRTENALDSLFFQLYPNAYREGAKVSPISDLYAPAVYYQGESYGGIEVSSVAGAQSFAAGGEDMNILSVTLNEALYPDERVTLDFSFEVTLPHINHRLGIGEHTVNLAHFYPVLCAYADGGFVECTYGPNGDPFVSECADYSVTLTVPAEYMVAGATLAEQKDGTHVYEYRAENVRDVAFVLGMGMGCVQTEADGIPVSYYYIEDENPDLALTAAAESLAYFADTFGKYEYPAYTVVQTDFPYGGMEYPALSFISYSLLESEVPAVVVHETAHQWWYAMVGSNQYAEAWQDEGLAEYSSALFFGAHPQYGGSYRDFIETSERSYRAFFSVYSQVHGTANTRMSRPLSDYAGEYEYRNVAYDKGVILFDRIRDVTGEGRLLRALRTYKSRYSGKIASPADFISCFSLSGARVEELVLSFTEGKCVI